MLGDNGRSIWNKANGIDNSPVVPYSERKSISTEQTFDKDTIDATRLKALLTGMTEKLTLQMRNETRLTGCVTVKVRYSDFNTYTMQTRLPYTALDHIIIDKVMELFDKLYQRRLLVRLIGVRFSHLVQGTHQFTLFENTQKLVHLYQALDRMRNRYGKYAVQRAVGTGSSGAETKMPTFLSNKNLTKKESTFQ